MPVPCGFVYLDDLRNSDHCINIFSDMKTLITLFAIILLSSCAAKKETSSVTRLKKSDTLIIKQEKIVQPKGRYSLVLHEICDTITQRAKPVTQYITRGNDSIGLVINENNTLKLTVDNKEAVISDLRNELSKVNTKLEQTKNTVITKYKTPKWAWYTLIISVLSILYWLNRMFKWIPFV